MKLLYLAIYRLRDGEVPVRICQHEDLNSFSFWQRGTIREQLLFATRTFSQKTPSGTRQTLKMEDLPFRLHIYSNLSNFSGCLVSDEEYPMRVAHGFIAKILDALVQKYGEELAEVTEDRDFVLVNLASDFEKYQNPKEADKLMQIQKNLDDVKDIMSKNIDEVLNRGETLESLMSKSKDLSQSSVTFYKTAKKNNQCCQLY